MPSSDLCAKYARLFTCLQTPHMLQKKGKFAGLHYALNLDNHKEDKRRGE